MRIEPGALDIRLRGQAVARFEIGEDVAEGEGDGGVPGRGEHAPLMRIAPDAQSRYEPVRETFGINGQISNCARPTHVAAGSTQARSGRTQTLSKSNHCPPIS